MATAVLCFLIPQPSEALTLDFVNNYASEYHDDQVWLMWAQSSSVLNPMNKFEVTYGNGTAVTLDNFSSQQSTAVNLASNDIASKGMDITYANSATLYIGFGDTNPFPTIAAPAFQTDKYQFMQVEITSTGAQADVADLTAINYFSFPLSLASYQAGGATSANLLQSSGFGANTTDSIISALQSTFSGTAPEIIDDSNKLVRILGPSSTYTVGAGPSGFSTGGYATFGNYLGLLYSQQENPDPSQRSTLKLSYTGNGGYTADARITDDGSGNYGVVIENVVQDTNSGPGTPVSGNITIFPDTPTNSPASVTIYSGVLHVGAGTISGELMGSGLESTLLASLSASLVSGAAGSTTSFPGNTDPSPDNQYRFQLSNSWFTQNSPSAGTDPGLFFDDLQTEAYYDDYFRVISQMSDFSLYGSPYADRFSGIDVTLFTTKYGLPSQPYSEWVPVDRLVVTIGPATVPEPCSFFLFAASGLIMAHRPRRSSALSR